MKQPTFVHRVPASERASTAARGASKKSGTQPEILLRRSLWRAGFRYRINDESLPGKPDIVFRGARVAVFCDGDFWHGRNWSRRKVKLKRGHNGDYWVTKIERNMERDRENVECLKDMGWTVIRVWEGDIKSQVEKVVKMIKALVYKNK